MSQTNLKVKKLWNEGHPLYGAILRFKRFEEHLEDVITEIGKFESACANEISKYGGKIPTAIKYPAIPTMLPLIVSDAIQNLRMALDYIVYELAIKDSGQPQVGTQFLIEDCKGSSKKAIPCHTCGRVGTKHGFDGRRERCLPKLSSNHIGMIESYQPYKGVFWTKTLRDISNRDKHRTITLLSTAGRSITFWEAQPGGQGFPSPNVQGQSSTVDLSNVEVNAGNTFAIEMPDGSKVSLMATLHNLQTEVLGAIERFAPEFP